MSRLRRHRRGVATTEALGFVIVSLVLLGGLIFMFRVYSQKHESKAEARALAWTHALGSCDGDTAKTAHDDGADLHDVLDDSEASDSPELGPDGEQLFDEANQSGELELGESWGVAEVRVERPAVSILGYASQPITSEFRVQCDEKPRGGDAASVLGFLWDLRNTVNFQ
jgi:hypothetical protein